MSGPLALLIAQHGGHGSSSGTGEIVMTILLATVLAVIWISLGVVCWIFWRAKKREDAEKSRKEMEWSARSS
jgi:hypothetical protein